MMKRITFMAFLLLGFSLSNYAQTSFDQSTNLLSGGLKDYRWMNKPDKFKFYDNAFMVEAGHKTDFFNNPETGDISDNAPFLFTEVKGDFVAKVLLKPDLSTVWNACGVMVYLDENNWIKFEFENSDATGSSIVSVVTKETSDDSNGAVLNNLDQVWLKVARKGDVYSMLWSIDDKDYKMARLVKMKSMKKVKLGLEAQCPSKGPAEHHFLYYSLEKHTIENVRTGI